MLQRAQHPHYFSLFSPFPLAFFFLIFLCMVSVSSPEVRTDRVPCLRPLFLLCLCLLSCLPRAFAPFCVESVRRVGSGSSSVSGTCSAVPAGFPALSQPGSCVQVSSPFLFLPRPHACSQGRYGWGTSFPPCCPGPQLLVPIAVWRSSVWATATLSTGTRRCSA